MRAAPVFLILWCAVADAGTRVVLLTDPGRTDLAPALQVALANRHVDVASEPPPAGTLRFERAAAVARTAISKGADAGIWIDVDAGGSEVCVVSSDGRWLRHAPLPTDLPPRVFAAIATSLMDELLAPPESPSVDIYVDVHANPPSAPPPMMPAPPKLESTITPPSLAAVTSTSVDSDPIQARTLLELGVTASPATLGFEAELLYLVRPSWRVGVLAGVNRLYDGIDDVMFQVMPGGMLADAGVEVRHVGGGRTHVDVGLVGGVVSTADTTMGRQDSGFAALRVSLTRDMISLSVAPTVLGSPTDTRWWVPGVMASLRWGSAI